MDYLFKEHGIKHGHEDAKLFDLKFDLVVKRLEAEESGEPPKCDHDGGYLSGSHVSASVELSSGRVGD
ncbi:uncharacterized protein N7529_006358 [Penicillium soppii]|jgi:hypothetical protein|uniref:uncharacterized protein n=1 Tax=Penicillium soppii TaxID=69789 RepID=UPI0025495501|nr:uncharacterized protein N7529_006358 [Penicillium soppii]KAJ5864442.1 hypothetical protein N7529_006358 [Penicillium soppii]